jgi:hypothetical protein
MARASWITSDDPEKYGDAMLLCQNGDPSACTQDAGCKLGGFCFRGLGSPEIRRGIEQRLDVIERELHALMVEAIPERTAHARRVLDSAEALEARVERERGIVLEFKRRRNIP